MSKLKRKLIAPGVYQGPSWRSAHVSVGNSRVGKLQSAHHFDVDESMSIIKTWQNEERTRLGKLLKKAANGPFDLDVVRYLETLADRPRLKAERAHQLAWWADQRGPDGKRFGDRRRHTFEASELHAKLAARALLPSKHHPGERMSASSLRHYRTALFHLFTILDGKSAPNPVKDVPAPTSPDPEPRAIPYAIIEAIFNAMKDQRRATRVDDAQTAEIVAAAGAPGANRSAIARQYGITEAAVRKILARRDRPRDRSAAIAKLQLRVMAYVGLPPVQVAALHQSDVNWQDPSVLVQGRKKGKGSRTARLPLTPQGVVALRAFFAGGAAGRRVNTTSALRLWWRAIRKMVDRIAATDHVTARELLRSLQRVRARPYDLRHSYLTQAQLAGRNINATQQLAMHADSRQTQRYTLAAMSEELQDVVNALGPRLTGMG